MGDRNPVSADDLAAAVSTVLTALEPAVRRDWSVPAGTLEWSCARTADHLGRCLVAYAGQLAARPGGRYVSFSARADDDATPAHLLEFVHAGGRMLAAMVRTTPADARAFHPFGTADPEGFAGMGCVETLIHGHDIAAGFGLPLHPPPDLCARVLARMFPEVAAEPADPWTALRHATGRAALDGRPPVTAWQWRGAPLDA